MNLNPKFISNIKRLTAILLIAIVILLAFQIKHVLSFHIVNTSPSTSDVSTVTPIITVNFNRELSEKDLSVNVSPSPKTTTKVEGKSLVVSLPATTSAMSTKQTYTISIYSIEDAVGQKLTNLKLMFKPIIVAFSSLPKSTQDYILKNQSRAAANQPPSFSGTNDLINVGITTQQVQIYEQAVDNYAKGNNIHIGSVIINGNSVTSGGTSPGVFDVKFSFIMSNTAYDATIIFSNPEYAQVTIESSTGAQLYQYGNVNPSQ